MKTTKVIGLLAAVFMVTALFGGMVHAEPPADSPEWTSEEITHEDDDSNTMQTGWACELLVHNPHNSTHFPGRINVTSEVACNVAMEVELRAVLEKYNCLLWVCAWDQVAITNPPVRAWSYAEAHANIPCSEGTYRGKGRVIMYWPNGVWEIGEVVSPSITLSC